MSNPQIWVTWRGEDGRRHESTVSMRGANSVLDFRVYEDTALGSCPVGAVLNDFILVIRNERDAHTSTGRRLPDVVTRRRWASVRVKERKEIGDGNPLVLGLE